MDGRTYYRQQPYIYNSHPHVNNQQPYQSSYSPHLSSPQLTPYELYAKPAQPMNWMHTETEQPVHNQSSSQQGIAGVFTDQNGQVDFEKALSSIGQIASTYHQVSPIVQQLSSLLKILRQ